MRKLLVASQKGGVGKTTTSMNLAAATALAGARVLLVDADPLSSISSSLNLAQHPQRQSLREASLDLPGVLVSNVVPGLDVLSPYEDSGCSDHDLDCLLATLAVPAFEESYDCLIVDTPPFLGANPGQLLATCDQFILVMRAEPLAYRTLPAFLELVQRSRGRAIALRGILLTLPEGETPGGRAERELRGRFGMRILSQAIPHDEAVSQAVLFGQIVCHTSKEAPAAAAYHALVETLDLIGPHVGRRSRQRVEQSSALSALRLALKAVPPRHAAETCGEVSVSMPTPVVSSPRETLAPTRAVRSGVRRAVPTPPRAPEVPASPPRRRVTPITAIPVVGPLDGRARSWPVAPARPPEPVITVPAAANAPIRTSGPQPSVQGHVPIGMALLWVVMGVMVGVGLRFVQLPEHVIPFLVGTGVAVVMLLLMKPFHTQQAKAPSPPPPRKPASRRAEGRSDPSKRLSGLKRRIAPARKLGGD